jgi:formamidopyrimidine-DNA glycosylase
VKHLFLYDEDTNSLQAHQPEARVMLEVVKSYNHPTSTVTIERNKHEINKQQKLFVLDGSFRVKNGENLHQCPCCSNKLLRHIQSNRVFFFCRSCWQEMPLIDRE